MPFTAVWATPFADIKVLDRRVLVTTAVTKLTAREETAHLDDILAIPVCFVPQLTGDFAKGGIRDGLSKVVVCQHTLDVQVLDANHIVITNQFGRDLVNVVKPLVCDALLYQSYPDALLLAAVAALWLSGQFALRTSELLLQMLHTAACCTCTHLRIPAGL